MKFAKEEFLNLKKEVQEVLEQNLWNGVKHMLRELLVQRIGPLTDQQLDEILAETSGHVVFYSQKCRIRHTLSDVLKIAECVFKMIEFKVWQENRQKNSDPIERTH